MLAGGVSQAIGAPLHTPVLQASLVVQGFESLQVTPLAYG